MLPLQIEGASLSVMRYANHLHTIGMIGGLRHNLGGNHMRLFENQKDAVLFLLFVVYVRDKIETIPEQSINQSINHIYILILAATLHNLLSRNKV